MQFIKIANIQGGFSLDPDKYLDALPELLADLPEGAARFAADPDHYNFFGSRCVKDLKIEQMELRDLHGRIELVITFAPNQFKHEQWLRIAYSDVTSFEVSASGWKPAEVWPETRRLGDVQLDEILPHERGCSHEIQLTRGRGFIVARDLSAEWYDPE
ncbi:hypothetical protein J5X84_38460 [Streptosporangiaceae bacterium NEAU-GS5]|nr:hypothetical protein [Streptosporangiaceae bacterium NEAU-GS5]